MSSAVTPSSPIMIPHKPSSFSHDDLADLVDLDFSDTPPASATSTSFPITPLASSKTWEDWVPLIPRSTANHDTPKARAQALADEGQEGQLHGDDAEEAQCGVTAESDEHGDGAERGQDRSSVQNTPSKASEADSSAGYSESGDSTSSGLRAGATPFSSRSLRIARAHTPPSFFSRPTGQGVDSVLLSPVVVSATIATSPRSPTAPRVSSIYGENAMGYTASAGPASPTDTVHRRAPTQSAYPVSPILSFPVSHPVRISPPSGPSQNTAAGMVAAEGNMTSPHASNRPIPIVTPTPRRIPLPASEPSSTENRLIIEAFRTASPVVTDAAEQTPPLRSETETPIGPLARSFSSLTLSGKFPDPDSTESETASGDTVSPTPPLASDDIPGLSPDLAADPPSDPADDNSPTADPSPGVENEKDKSRSLRRSGGTSDWLAESLDEVHQLEQQWKEYRGAFGKISGGVNEVVARLRHNITGHTCGSGDVDRDELRDAREENVSLRREVHSLREQQEKRSGDAAYLQARCDNIALAYKKLKDSASASAAMEEQWRGKLDRLQGRYDALDEDRKHWHHREQQLAADFVAMEDQLIVATEDAVRYKRAAKGKEQVPVVFSVVLIECSAGLLQASYVKRGSVGGKSTVERVELAENILSAAQTEAGDLVVATMFMNFPDLQKKLIREGAIDREADLHDFLDGFRSVSGLFTVVDTDSPAAKLEDHLKLYSLLRAEKIVLASRRGSTYEATITSMSPESACRISAVRSAGSAGETFAFLDADHFIEVEGLMPGVEIDSSETVRTRATSIKSVTTAASQITTSEQSRSVPPHMRSPSVGSLKSEQTDSAKRPSWKERFSGTTSATTSASDTPLPPRDRFKPQLISPPSEQARRASPVPPTPPPELAPAPWGGNRYPQRSQVPDVHPQPDRRAAPVAASGTVDIPWWELGGTLNDEVMAQTAATSQAARGPADSTPNNQAPRTQISSPTPRQNRPAQTGGLRVPVDDIASLGGSPPDSDEDNPNVELPHSAVKRVQRPIEFSRQTGQGTSVGTGRTRSESVSSAGGSSVGQAYTSRILSQHGIGRRTSTSGLNVAAPSRNPVPAVNSYATPGPSRSVSGSNNTPLGSRGGVPEHTGKIYGFNIRGRGRGR